MNISKTQNRYPVEQSKIHGKFTNTKLDKIDVLLVRGTAGLCRLTRQRSRNINAPRICKYKCYQKTSYTDNISYQHNNNN